MNPGYDQTPGGANAFLEAARWLQGILTGSLAISVAVIAVASIGFMMLKGRIGIRRSVTILTGCFILFGASTIVAGLKDLARPTAMVAQPTAPMRRSPLLERPAPLDSAEADPYAGAALRR